jgi:signal peptidase II
MEKISKYLYFLVCFAAFVWADLCTSGILAQETAEGLKISNPAFTLTYLKNSGAAFSLMQNMREALIILAVVALTLIFLYVIKNIFTLNFKYLFFIALLCAGIFGNLHERIQLGYVRDFFELNFINFPVFNISDIMINIGVITLIAMILVRKTK